MYELLKVSNSIHDIYFWRNRTLVAISAITSSYFDDIDVTRQLILLIKIPRVQKINKNKIIVF